MKKLPENLYVRWDGQEPQFLRAEQRVVELIETPAIPVEYGVYKLIGKYRANASLNITAIGRISSRRKS